MKYIKGEVGGGVSFPLAIVVSQFNSEITNALLQGALSRLSSVGFNEANITIVEVPGAIEIPLIVQTLADKHFFGAIIALGAVIRGETTHYDYVCQQVSDGCRQAALGCKVPVIFGVLTTENEAQALDRLGGLHGHKGVESVDCALSMYSIMRQLEND